MSDDPYHNIHAALQHSVELMQHLSDQLKRDMENHEPLLKILTLTAQLSEMFAHREIPMQCGEINKNSYGGKKPGTVYLGPKYDELSNLLKEYYHPTPPKSTTYSPSAPPPPIPPVPEGEDEGIYINGIDAATGEPLLRIDSSQILSIVLKTESQEESKAQNDIYRKKIAENWLHEQVQAQDAREELPESVKMVREAIRNPAHLGTISDVDQNDIKQARWAVVVRAQEDVRVLQALWPLIEHRMRQMEFEKLDFDFQSGDTSCGAWLSRHTDGGKKTLANAWGKVPPVLLVQRGQEVNAWLSANGTLQAAVDPAKGVPFYLMIVARPGPLDPTDDIFIPWNFQYELDIFWGVGRLAFSDASGQHCFDAYRAYAERVVAWEDSKKYLSKEIAFFGTSHEGDPSTQRSANELVKPLIEWSKVGRIAKGLGIGQQIYLGEDATRDSLGKLLSASTPPAVLFTATHGIGMPLNDERLVMHQGALLTADFEVGNIKREHYLAGEDLEALSGANLDGMVAFLFACYGIGCPQQDEFAFNKDKPRKQIAPFPFIAQLPQRMLAKGALAILGHVDRAWTYSFSGEAGVDRQIQPFQDVIGRLLRGDPAGSATDQFNVIQGARSFTLAQELEYFDEYRPPPDQKRIARLWMARNDARNYAMLGDPAVRLRLPGQEAVAPRPMAPPPDVSPSEPPIDLDALLRKS